MGIRCQQKRRFKTTTNSRHNLPVADNLLKQDFHATSPGHVWLSDITYIPTDEGWPYLTAHKDMRSRKIVGYAMGPRMTRNLVRDSPPKPRQDFFTTLIAAASTAPRNSAAFSICSGCGLP